MHDPFHTIPLIVVLGPTATGKSGLAIALAKKFHGEIISADSRQVYRGMNLGTGKVTKKEMRGVPHFMLDITSPRRTYSVAQYQRKARTAIRAIHARGNVPILCGGTGLYIQSVVQGVVFPHVKPNMTLRRTLDTLSTDALFARLKKMDSSRASTIDPHNRRRLVRAIEIAEFMGAVPQLTQEPYPGPLLLLGVNKTKSVLTTRIHARLFARMRAGMIREVEHLHTQGISWKRLDDFGLEYRFVSRYLRGMLTKQEMLQQLEKEIGWYAKRQATWFKRDSRIHWIRSPHEATTLVKKFLSNT